MPSAWKGVTVGVREVPWVGGSAGGGWVGGCCGSAEFSLSLPPPPPLSRPPPPPSLRLSIYLVLLIGEQLTQLVGPRRVAVGPLAAPLGVGREAAQPQHLARAYHVTARDDTVRPLRDQPHLDRRAGLVLRGIDARADDALGAEGLHDGLEEGAGVLALHGERVLPAATREQLERLQIRVGVGVTDIARARLGVRGFGQG